jgi:putative transposase
VILFSDEAGISLEPKLGVVWGLRGAQPIVPTNSSWSRVNLTGFVDPVRGKILVTRMAKGNSENFVEQLNLVKKKYRRKTKITLYVDNARWHKTKIVKEWEANNINVKIEFLPKYAPELNPIERHWWYLRKETTQNVLYKNEEECWKSINGHFKSLTPKQIKILCQI